MEQVKSHAEKTLRQLQIIRTYEANFQDTLNVEELAEKRAIWLASYKDARARRRNDIFYRVERKTEKEATVKGNFTTCLIQ